MRTGEATKNLFGDAGYSNDDSPWVPDYLKRLSQETTADDDLYVPPYLKDLSAKLEDDDTLWVPDYLKDLGREAAEPNSGSARHDHNETDFTDAPVSDPEVIHQDVIVPVFLEKEQDLNVASEPIDVVAVVAAEQDTKKANSQETASELRLLETAETAVAQYSRLVHIPRIAISSLRSWIKSSRTNSEQLGLRATVEISSRMAIASISSWFERVRSNKERTGRIAAAAISLAFQFIVAEKPAAAALSKPVIHKGESIPFYLQAALAGNVGPRPVTDHEVTINTGADLVKEAPVTTTTNPPAPVAEAPVVPANRVEMPKTTEEYRKLKAANKTLNSVNAKYKGVTGQLANEELELLNPEKWAGHRLTKEAAESFSLMAAHFEREFGRPLQLTDSYRDLHGQHDVARRKPGLAATPGTSFHGTGIAADFASNINNFDSAEHNWMREHAAKYGWIHPPWAQRGGSKPEAWHWEFLLPLTVVAPAATVTTPSVVTAPPAPVESTTTTSGATSPASEPAPQPTPTTT